MITIELFSRPGCPHCPPARVFITNFVKGKDNITLKQINTLTPEGQILAQKFNVMTVPTIFVSSDIHPQRIGFRGTPTENDLNRALEVITEKPKEEKPSFIKKLFKG
ncbi:MAG: thioredoxin family protein [Nanoarchaeota archaeon]|nr:thioredoxin family protein [Nanoarchaeota archaeon]